MPSCPSAEVFFGLSLEVERPLPTGDWMSIEGRAASLSADIWAACIMFTSLIIDARVGNEVARYRPVLRIADWYRDQRRPFGQLFTTRLLHPGPILRRGSAASSGA